MLQDLREDRAEGPRRVTEFFWITEGSRRQSHLARDWVSSEAAARGRS